MRFWFARDSEVPIREQFVKQVILGILSGDLQPGERLPSLSDLVRRFKLHQNTISAAYRKLERDGWLELRRGSGVYVRPQRDVAVEQPASHSPARVLDQQIAMVFSLAREHGIPLAQVRLRLSQWLAKAPADHFLVIEPDEHLREIVVAEITQAVGLPVHVSDLEASNILHVLPGSTPVVLPSKAQTLRELLPTDTEIIVLQIRSIPSSLSAWLPAKPDLLVGVASSWPDFLVSARTMLVAAGFPADGLVLRDARSSNWHRGLRETAAVVCDTVTANRLPQGCRAICFPLLAESTVEKLRRYERAIRRPIAQEL
jgi:GntR family transcriptional regulator